MKNIIKILMFLISVVTYAQVQPVNYYQQLNKVNEADENDSIQVLVRTVGNPDHNIVKYVNASDIGGGGGDMPDVSATERGVVNNTPLQELGGVDKLINGVRIGRGASNINSNVALGVRTLDNADTTTIENTAIGAVALRYITSGSSNTGVGTGALMNSTTASWNSAIGATTLLSNTTGSMNVAVGTSLYYNSTGSRNTGVGFNAGYSATTGQRNTYIGSEAGYNQGTGSFNVAIGARTLGTNWTGTTPSTFSMNRNVIIGASVQTPDGTDDVLAIDNKGLTTTLFSNALLYGNFADRFLRINGRFEIDDATMPTADVDFTKKLVWNPTTGVVGITDDVATESEFVKITEDGKTGWGLKYRADNPNYYGNIGNNAVDLGYSGNNSTTRGATGNNSTISGGQNNQASGDYSTASGGQQNTASSANSTVSGGANNTASGQSSIVSGGDYNIASGTYSIVSGGRLNTANSYGEWVGGLFGTIPTGQNATSFVATDRLFNVGNGTTSSARSDAFTILKNGLATLPSVTNALIDAEPTGKAVVTKEWVEDAINDLVIPEQVNLTAGTNINITGTYPNLTINSTASGGGGGDTNIIESISRDGTPITPDGSKNVDIPVFSTSGAGLVPARVGAVTTKYLREDGTWVTPTNTTYSAMTLAVLNTGTATTANTISAQVLTNWLNGKVSTVGFSGSYNDLIDKPTIPTQVNLTEGDNITITGTYPNLEISAEVPEVTNDAYKFVTDTFTYNGSNAILDLGLSEDVCEGEEAFIISVHVNRIPLFEVTDFTFDVVSESNYYIDLDNYENELEVGDIIRVKFMVKNPTICP